MRVKLQLVLCDDDGQDETVTDVVTLKKDHLPMDPLRDLGTAVAHQTLSGQTLTAGEALIMAEALRSQTINAAATV